MSDDTHGICECCRDFKYGCKKPSDFKPARYNPTGFLCFDCWMRHYGLRRSEVVSHYTFMTSKEKETRESHKIENINKPPEVTDTELKDTSKTTKLMEQELIDRARSLIEGGPIITKE